MVCNRFSMFSSVFFPLVERFVLVFGIGRHDFTSLSWLFDYEHICAAHAYIRTKAHVNVHRQCDCVRRHARDSRSAGQPPTACITATRNLGVKRCGSWYISPRVRFVRMAHPGHHADGSEGIGSFFGLSKTRRGLTKAVGTDQADTVNEILKNTKSGPGLQIYEFKQMLKTIKESLNIKMQETGDLNKEFVRKALEELMREAMPIIQEANAKIMKIKPEKMIVNTATSPEEDDESDEDFGNSEPEPTEDQDTRVTGTLGYETAASSQPPGSGLFMMHVPNAPWGGPVQMQTTNSCAPNAHAMLTPMPVHNYCVVHANAHGLGGAQGPFLNAACGPWQSAQCGAPEGDCAQPQVCYVMAR